MSFRSGYIAIIGQPNAGKSTLLNRIIGEEVAIATAKPQTTRQKIIGIHNLPGAQLVFMDTPGFHESDRALNKYMQGVIGDVIRDADVVCLMIEAKSEPDALDLELAAKCATKQTILVLNKTDTFLGSRVELRQRYQSLFPDMMICMTAAIKGEGVEDLIGSIVEKLPEGPQYFPVDLYTQSPVRFLAAEIVREQVLNLCHQEVPYSVAVQIESFKEKPDITVIKAAIVVEKDSHKAIVIGKEGRMIKEIGRHARAKIETLVGTKVFLELFVKVEKNWTKDFNKTREMLGEL